MLGRSLVVALLFLLLSIGLACLDFPLVIIPSAQMNVEEDIW